MSEKIIEVSNLVKSYGAFRAVDGLSFGVQSGDVYGFLGPNGAGKSTTIRMLLTLIRPQSGEIRIFGKPLRENRSSILAHTGAIVEKPDFYLYLPAEKNVILFSRLSGYHPTRSRLEEIFSLVGLKGREKDPVKAYSHGMRQRLGLAQALIHDPQLVILDEPTTGLDPQGIIDMRNLITHLSRDLGKTVVLSSHILSEIELIATRMLIMDKGKAVVEGSVAELLHATALVAGFTVDDPQQAMAAVNGSSWRQLLDRVEDGRLIFHIGKEDVPWLNAFFCSNGVGVTAIDSRKKLEDYFLNLTAVKS